MPFSFIRERPGVSSSSAPTQGLGSITGSRDNELTRYEKEEKAALVALGLQKHDKMVYVHGHCFATAVGDAIKKKEHVSARDVRRGWSKLYRTDGDGDGDGDTPMPDVGGGFGRGNHLQLSRVWLTRSDTQIARVGRRYGLHATQVSKWSMANILTKQIMENRPGIKETARPLHSLSTPAHSPHYYV